MTTPTPPTVIAAVEELVAPSPKVTGGVLFAPRGTPLPVDATSPLDPAFISLGRVSVDGVDRTEDRGKIDVNDWGGSLVAVLQDKYGMTLKFKLLQMVNADVQRAAHGTDNVEVIPATISSGTQINTKYNAQLLDQGVWVIDAYYMAMSMRLVCPVARPVTIGPMKWVHKELSAYDLTLQPFPDNDSNFAYEYLDDGVTL